jgi:oligopeptide transport system ATP-binding protein
MADAPLLRLTNVSKHFQIKGAGVLKAVNNVSLDIARGETLGLVGESGCGKTTLGRTIVKLYKNDGGQIEYQGRDIWSMNRRENMAYRKMVQMIFQDPYASLDPLNVVSQSVAEGPDIHGLYRGKKRRDRVLELLNMVGLNREHANRFPHEFSGGQRQRIGIARALAVEPELIVCDEPISALDVSIQAQIVNLLMRLQKEMGLSYLFITHDLSMVRQISDRIAVMYLGSIVEIAPARALYESHRHPYTKALLSAIPIPDPDVEEKRQRIILPGDVPSPINLGPGCSFKDRCPIACDRCRAEAPALREIAPGHSVACHLA